MSKELSMNAKYSFLLLLIFAVTVSADDLSACFDSDKYLDL